MISRGSMAVAALIALPIVVYACLGGYALWRSGLFWWTWWMAPLCWLLAGLLGRWWKLGHATAAPTDPVIARHFTPRDRAAAQIVRDFQLKVEKFTPNQLTTLAVYQSEVQALAETLARHYHPDASDPYSSLTAPELLAAVRLAVDDLERWLLTSVPGSRLLTIRQWKSLESAPKWFDRFSKASWVVQILMDPSNLAKLFVSKVALEPVTTGVQTELLAAVYLRFFQQIGFYLIEMNSGRLRGGADAYRKALPLGTHMTPELASGGQEGSGAAAVLSQGPAAQPVSIALVGQVSAGKSSLVNALTRSRSAGVDVLPETMEVTRYQMSLGEPPVVVTLLDTPGYGDVGATPAQIRQIATALRDSNVVLLVMDAHSPAREADRRTLRDLETWYTNQPRLKPPPMLGVLTHVDLLRPVLEWSPPYDWREPRNAKERSMLEAVEYARELFGQSLVDILPVCADQNPDRAWGVLEELVPALTISLPDAQSAALLRAFEQELDRDRLKIVLQQVRRFGSDLWKTWIDQRLGTGTDGNRGESSRRES